MAPAFAEFVEGAVELTREVGFVAHDPVEGLLPGEQAGAAEAVDLGFEPLHVTPGAVGALES